MKKILLLGVVLLVGPYLFLYVKRWNYRNDQSLLGRVVYTLFDLNRLTCESEQKDIRIFWYGADQNGLNDLSALIYADGISYTSRIPGSYGTNALVVYAGTKKIGSFSWMHNPWWQTNDYEVMIKRNGEVSLKIDRWSVENSIKN